jgi:hypothetical protein
VQHGDVEGTIAAIREAAARPKDDRLAMGYAAVKTVNDEFSRQALLSRICDQVESLVR